MNVKEYWDKRISENGKYSSIGHQSYGELANKRRKKSVFGSLDKILSKNFSEVAGKNVLDVGCGTGIYSRYYRRKEANIYGIDISEESIKQLEKEKVEGNFVQSDITNIPFNLKFDVIHCFSVLYHVIDDDKWMEGLKQIYKHIKSDGTILLRVNWTENVNNTAKHVKKRSISDYEELFEKIGLRIVDKYDIEDIPVTKQFSYLPNIVDNIAAACGLFSKNKEEKIIVLKKK